MDILLAGIRGIGLPAQTSRMAGRQALFPYPLFPKFEFIIV